MDIVIEQGTSVGRPRHRHNGYYAGDFSGRPLPTGLRRDLMALPRPLRVSPPVATRGTALRAV